MAICFVRFFYSRYLMPVFPSGFSANLWVHFEADFFGVLFFLSKMLVNRMTGLFAVYSIRFLMTSCLISAVCLHSALYPKRLLWNLFYHWNQCSSPVLTRGYFCSFTPSWIFLDVTCASSVWYLSVFWDSAVAHSVSFSDSGSCRIFSAFFPHYFSKNYFFIFLSCVPFKTTRILLRSASIWLSKVCLLENVQSWWIFFKTANVFYLNVK